MSTILKPGDVLRLCILRRITPTSRLAYAWVDVSQELWDAEPQMAIEHAIGESLNDALVRLEEDAADEEDAES